MSQEPPQDQAAEEHPGIEAAYERTPTGENVGMRALAGLFLLEHEFRRVPGQPHLARLVVNRLNRFAPYDCAVFWTCSPRGKVYDVTISGIIKNKDTKPILDWGRELGKWLNKTGYGNTQLTPAMVDMEKSMAHWPGNLPKSGLSPSSQSLSSTLLSFVKTASFQQRFPCGRNPHNQAAPEYVPAPHQFPHVAPR